MTHARYLCLITRSPTITRSLCWQLTSTNTPKVEAWLHTYSRPVQGWSRRALSLTAISHELHRISFCNFSFRFPYSSRRRAYVLPVFHIYLQYLFLMISVWPIIYLTDLPQICRVGRTVAANKRSELVSRSLKGHCCGNQFLLVLLASIHRTGFVRHSVDGGVREEVQVLHWVQVNQSDRLPA